MASDYEKVLQFTKESGFQVPEKPEKMSEDEVYFLAKMLLDEIMELCATVSYSFSETEGQDVLGKGLGLGLGYKKKLIKMIEESRDHNINFKTMSSEEIIAEQVDAVVDLNYYSLNAMAKKNINYAKVFDLVHEANMKKRCPETGKFLRREDGKIIKPIGWKAPDILSEIKRQLN